MISAGKYDRKISIEGKQVTVDPDYGTETIAWVTIASRIWANIQDVLPSRSEQVKQGVAVATMPARIRIRYRTDLTPDMRVIVHGITDQVFQIIGGPAEVGKKEATELVVEAYSV
ncbi:MAG: phage head closure protein [Rhodocyclaceae bacterium]|nr:phage head closure protein [Rhodocyclaceae bacterium]